MTAPLKPSVLCDLQPASDIRSAAFWAECQAATKVLSTVHMASAGPSSQSEPLCNGTLAAHARITGQYEDGVKERGRKKKKRVVHWQLAFTEGLVSHCYHRNLSSCTLAVMGGSFQNTTVYFTCSKVGFGHVYTYLMFQFCLSD